MYILIDIGGTNTRVALTRDRKTFGEPIIFSTPAHFDLWLAEITEHITALTEGVRVSSIVAGLAGTLSSDHAVLHASPHLPDWEGINIKEKLAESFLCPIIIENDAALVGLGECVYGSGKGHDIAVYITLSTGVGGVRIVDGKIDKSTYGFEIGHQIVEDGKELEYYLAGSSHEKRFGMPSKDIKDLAFWKEVNHYVGVLGANTMMYWSPSVIVFGGPVTNDVNLDEAHDIAKTLAPMYEVIAEFKKSSLGALGGIYGALAYLQSDK
jgi:glucokinase